MASAGPASAALVAVDWKTPGDALLTSDGQFEWLDLTLTANRQYFSVLADTTEAGGAYQGFQFATAAQVAALFSSAGLSSVPPDPGTPEASAAIGAADNLLALLGVTVPASAGLPLVGSGGFVLQTSPTLVDVATLERYADTAYYVVSPGFGGNPTQSPFLGSFLVRPIPEPSTYLLLAGGLLVLAAAARRR